jgi:hypothetical protein
MSYEEGDGYVLGPSPIELVRIFELFVWVMAIVALTSLSFTGGYRAGHTAATAAIHGEAE